MLVIGATWPEPTATGAGVRMMQLLKYFLQNHYKVTFACTAQPLIDLTEIEKLSISCKQIVLNDTSFDDFIKEERPSIVLFDRFITEEQFGWRVAQYLPHALRILDLEDLHCLRKVRHECIKKEIPFSIDRLKQTDITKREIASIYRCDLSLVISSFEFELLTQTFGINEELLLLLPFMFEALNENKMDSIRSFSERNDFITIGNFLHEPNWDSVLYLKKVIWPEIRKRLPKANMLVYGAYASEKVKQLHNVNEGFLVCGQASNSEDVLNKAKVLLAPLRFGAGLKTKLVDGMRYGTPNVTTAIGAEGLHVFDEWNGKIADSAIDFAMNAVELYQDKTEWIECQKQGFEMFNTLFNSDLLSERLTIKINNISDNILTHRGNNFVGQMLLHHTLQSTKYLSKWISEKQKQ